MPLSNLNHLSPTGERVTPLPESDTAPRTPLRPITLDASQLNADVAAYVRELEQLRKLVLLKVMGEANSSEISELRDTVAERDELIEAYQYTIERMNKESQGEAD